MGFLSFLPSSSPIFLVAVVVVPQWGIKLREQSDLSQPVDMEI